MRITAQVIGVIVLMAAVAIAAFSLAGFVIMLVWNGLADYFHFQQINFWIGVLIAVALSIVENAFRSGRE